MFPGQGTSLSEFFEFARKIGLKDEWFQDKDIPHFDVSKSKKQEAILMGAVPIDLNSAKGSKIFMDSIKYWREVKHGKKY
jgi:hypothetical protein